MHLQTRFFRYDQEKELNKFLTTAHLYNTADIPAIVRLEAGVSVMIKPEPSLLDPFIAAETLNSTITKLKENLVEYEADRRQWSWRLEWRKERKAELEKEVSEAENQMLEILRDEPNRSKDREGWKRWNESKKDAIAALNKKLNKARKELADLEEQVIGLETQLEVLDRKEKDTKKDMDVAIQFVKDIESGAFEIYGNPPKK